MEAYWIINMCLVNSDKLLSRVIHNIYASFSDVTLNEEQLSLLRKGKYCGEKIVDCLLHYFKLVEKRRGLISFKTLSYYFLQLSSINLMKNEELYTDLQKMFYDKKIALLLHTIKISNIKSQYKLLLSSLCANTIFYEENGCFLVIKKQTLANYSSEDTNNELRNKIVKLSSNYYEKHDILNISQIREMVDKMINSFNLHTKFDHIYLFGSYAKEEATLTSDIDLFCIVNKSKFCERILSDYISYYFKRNFNYKVDAVVKLQNKNFDKFDLNVLGYAKLLV